jgi:molecular chaperone DnaK (HSP70)
MRRIAEASETAKCALSTTHSATVDLRSLRNDIDYRAVIDRELADSLWTDLFALALGHVEDAVNAADIQDVDIDNVILAGGSTRSLAIQRLLKERFPHAQHDRSMDNGESAAYGAAIQASALAHDCTESLGIEVIIDDALPAAIGIEVQGGFMATILARNAPIPSYRSQIFTNHMDKQTEVRLPVYQGDANLARDCELIGILSLSGLASVDRGLSRIEVSILLDQDHSPEIVATDLATGYSTTLVVLKDHRLHWTDVPLIPDIRGMEVILA